MSNKNSSISYLLIVNPKAGGGISNNRINSIKRFLENRSIEYHISLTKSSGEAAYIAREALDGNFSHIISVGGDGTSSEIANSIVGSKLIFGVIPNGSGNDFPKASNIPLDFDKALNTIVEGKLIKADVGKFSDKYFINGFGIGFDGAVAARFKSFKRFGAFSGYLIGALVESVGFDSFKGSVKIKGNHYSGNYVMFGASNGSYQGGKFRLAPKAEIDDGELDFHIIEDMNPIRRILTVAKSLNGSHVGVKEVNILKGKEIEFEFDRNLPAHMDGEAIIIPSGNHKISILEKAVNVLTSAN